MAWACTNDHQNRDDGAKFCRECGVAKRQQAPPAAQQPSASATDQQVAELQAKVQTLIAAQNVQTSADPAITELKAEVERLKKQLSAQQKPVPPEKKEGRNWGQIISEAFWKLK